MEGGIRVPTLAMMPGVIPAGSVVAMPTSNMDVMPTVAELSGAPLPSDRIIDGRSMMPLLSGKTRDATHEMLFHYCGEDIHAARYAPPGSEYWVALLHFFEKTPYIHHGNPHCEAFIQQVYCPASRTTLVATRFRVAVICPIIQVPHCIRVFFYFVWFVFINHIFQFYYELCTYCNILDIYLS